jgi:DNA-binding MarR family transcriptional regulator
MSRRAPVGAEHRIGAPSSDEGLSVGQLMGRARAALLTSIDTEIERFGLNSTQFAVLKHLGEGTAQTAADLCRLNHYDTGAMTRILDHLEEKGMVRRERGREDRRVVFLRLAPQGRALLPRLMAVATRVLEVHLAGFSVDEVEALKGYLQRMIDNGPSQRDNQRSASGGKP